MVRLGSVTNIASALWCQKKAKLNYSELLGDRAEPEEAHEMKQSVTVPEMDTQQTGRENPAVSSKMGELDLSAE